MGQRHNVYLCGRAPLSPFTPEHKRKYTIGYHCQWLQGLMVIRAAEEFLRFANSHLRTINHEWVSPLEHEVQANILQSFYQTDRHLQVYNQISRIVQPFLGDPRVMDNDTGITIFDATTPAVSYCFMKMSDDGNKINSDWPKLPLLTPISAEQYIKAIYPDNKPIISVSDYAGLLRERDELISQFSRYGMLTLERVKELIPKMFDGSNAAKRRANYLKRTAGKSEPAVNLAAIQPVHGPTRSSRSIRLTVEELT